MIDEQHTESASLEAMALRADRLADAANLGIAHCIETDTDCANATSADVCNGALTLANRMILVVLAETPAKDAAMVRQSLKNAILTLLMNTATGETPIS